MKSITFLVLMFILKQAFGQKPAIGVIKVESNFYLNKPIVLQGGIFPDSYGYNDFNYVDTNFTILNSVKPLLQDDKKYKIAVNTGYPHPFQFAYFDTVKLTGSSSFYFFIDNGITHVKLKDFSKEKYVLAGKLSKSNREYLRLQNLYKQFVSNTNIQDDDDIAGRLTAIKHYIKKYPESIVALWDLVFFYPSVRKEIHKKNVLEVVQSFSVKVKSTKTYLALIDNISQDLRLAEGNKFPNTFLIGKDSLLNIVSKNKYTLIDFWFASCQPCLAQFGKLSEIYAFNKSRGFEIVGISTDAEASAPKWQSVISRFSLKWIQHLDAGGVEAAKLYIRKFPSNFLLDKDGQIIKVDIEPEALQEFLKKTIL